MEKESFTDPWETQLMGYEKAIADLQKTQEELQEKLKILNSFKIDYLSLKEELNQANQEIQGLRNKLQVVENTIAAIQQTQNHNHSQVIGHEKAMNYLYEQLESTKKEIQDVKETSNISQGRINSLENISNTLQNKLS